ncbi:MAG: hypothetical protein ACRDJ1_01485 [Actinomycetota bacterium]
MKRLGCVPIMLALLGASACSETATTKATNEAPAKPPFAVNVDATAFDATSTTIDNQWWPLKPGTQLTWEGQALEGEEVIRRRIVFTVTDLTKEIAGVRTLVGWDRDFNDGTLVESELIFLAQDKAGNVWHFGQYAELWDEGQYDGGSAWLVGYLDGAKAGILMPADPQLGQPAYSEGYAPPPFYWDDFARVHRTGVKTCVPAGCYTDVLVIEEFEPTKPGASQLKYYARGVGSVRTGWLGEEEEEQEELGLVRSIMLTPAQLAEARAEALKLEARATLFGLTIPIETPAE